LDNSKNNLRKELNIRINLKISKMIKLAMFGLIFLVIVVCVWLLKKRTIRGNGNNIILKRSIEDYEAIRVSDSLHVELVDGMTGNLIINGEENLLKHVLTEVKKGELRIAIEKMYRLRPSLGGKKIQITVPVEQINSIKILGSGDVISKKTLQSQGFKTEISGSGNINTDLEVETLFANVAGSGYLNFSGKAKSFQASSSGNCNINAYALEAEDVGVSLAGSGIMKVKAKKKLKARVAGSGYIQYQGNPENVDLETAGSGKVLKE